MHPAWSYISKYFTLFQITFIQTCEIITKGLSIVLFERFYFWPTGICDEPNINRAMHDSPCAMNFLRVLLAVMSKKWIIILNHRRSTRKVIEFIISICRRIWCYTCECILDRIWCGRFFIPLARLFTTAVCHRASFIISGFRQCLGRKLICSFLFRATGNVWKRFNKTELPILDGTKEILTHQ